MYLVYLFVFWTDLPKVACQNCPSVEEAPSLKTVLDAFCRHDFGGFHSLQLTATISLSRRFDLKRRTTQAGILAWKEKPQ